MGLDDYTNQINNDLSPEFSGDELRWQVEYAISEHQTKLNKSMIGEISDYKVNNNTKWEITNIDDQNYYAIDITFDKESNLSLLSGEVKLKFLETFLQ